MKISAIVISIVLIITVVRPQFQASAASSTDFTSDCLQEQANSAAGSNSLVVSFNGPPALGDTVVLMLAYGNKANRKNFKVSGLGSSVTWTPGYAPGLKKGFGMAFFYGTGLDGSVIP